MCTMWLHQFTHKPSLSSEKSFLFFAARRRHFMRFLHNRQTFPLWFVRRHFARFIRIFFSINSEMYGQYVCQVAVRRCFCWHLQVEQFFQTPFLIINLFDREKWHEFIASQAHMLDRVDEHCTPWSHVACLAGHSLESIEYKKIRPFKREQKNCHQQHLITCVICSDRARIQKASSQRREKTTNTISLLKGNYEMRFAFGGQSTCPANSCMLATCEYASSFITLSSFFYAFILRGAPTLLVIKRVEAVKSFS